MSHIIREVPELHEVLEKLLMEHIKVIGPTVDKYWIPCDCCDSVFPVRHMVVSAICEDCAAPCEYADCGLMQYEHKDNGGYCEPREEIY